MTCAITKCYLHCHIVTCFAWWRDTIYQSAINRFINIVHTFGCVWHDKGKKTNKPKTVYPFLIRYLCRFLSINVSICMYACDVKIFAEIEDEKKRETRMCGIVIWNFACAFNCHYYYQGANEQNTHSLSEAFHYASNGKREHNLGASGCVCRKLLLA